MFLRIGSYAPVGDCCLTPTQQFLSYVMERTRFLSQIENYPIPDLECLDYAPEFQHFNILI
jgi:hypothetical protein